MKGVAAPVLAVVLAVTSLSGCRDDDPPAVATFCDRVVMLDDLDGLDDELWLDPAAVAGLEDRSRTVLDTLDRLDPEPDLGLGPVLDTVTATLRAAVVELDGFGFDVLAATTADDPEGRAAVAGLSSPETTRARAALAQGLARACGSAAFSVGTAPVRPDPAAPVDARAVDPAELEPVALVEVLVGNVSEDELAAVFDLTGRSSVAALRQDAARGRLVVDDELIALARDLLVVDGPGDDPVLDELVDACEDGTLAACDALWFQAPLRSTYERIGGSCGGRVGDQSLAYGCAAGLG